MTGRGEPSILGWRVSHVPRDPPVYATPPASPPHFFSLLSFPYSLPPFPSLTYFSPLALTTRFFFLPPLLDFLASHVWH
jgi:hypothetical protein